MNRESGYTERVRHRENEGKIRKERIRIMIKEDLVKFETMTNMEHDRQRERETERVISAVMKVNA